MSRYFKKTKWGLYLFAAKIGFSSLFRKNYRIGLKQLLYPIGYWRLPAFSTVIDDIGNKGGITVLDIGSPKLLSLYLALEFGQIVYATDLQDKNIFDRYQQHYYDFIFSKKENKYIVELQDAQALKYSNNFFDYVYSISVIEHIPDDGDKEAMSEIMRVLKPNGKAVIEVPFAPEGYVTYINDSLFDRKYEGKPIFYQRHYDESTLLSRLIKPSRMKLIRKIITLERLPFENYWNKIPTVLKVPFLWLESFFSSLNHYVIINNTVLCKLGKNRSMSATLILHKTS